MTLTEIIGWVTDEMASQLREQGLRLRFRCFGRNGLPVHEVRR